MECMLLACCACAPEGLRSGTQGTLFFGSEHGAAPEGLGSGMRGRVEHGMHVAARARPKDWGQACEAESNMECMLLRVRARRIGVRHARPRRTWNVCCCACAPEGLE